MAHQISFNESGKAEMAYAGVKPWHLLGQQINGLMTTAEALRASHLDWTVSKIPVLSSYNLEPVPNAFTVIRDDTKVPLGIVGNRYEPISNRDAFQFFDIALGAGQGNIDTIGALGRGERVWCLAKMPETFEPLPGDPVERYLLCWTSHDGSKSMEVMFTNIRVVCNNTLSAAIQSCRSKVTIKHTSNWESRLTQAHTMLERSETYWQRMKEVSVYLAQSSVDRVQVGAFIEAMFPEKPDIPTSVQKTHGKNTVLRLLEEGRGAEIPGVQGSKWGLFNAYTEFLDHEQRAKKGTNLWERSVFGTGASDRQKAMNYLLAS